SIATAAGYSAHACLTARRLLLGAADGQSFSFFFQAEDGIRDFHVTGVQTCALPISAEAKHRVAVFNGDMKRGSKQVVELRAYSQVVLEKILGTAGDGTPGFVRKDEVELGDGRAVENGGDGDGVCRGFKRKPGAERVVGAVF